MIRPAVLALPVLLTVFAAPAAADIYKYVDKHGRVILTDTPRNSNYKRLVKTWKGWEESRSRIALEDFHKNRKLHTPAIDRYARRYGLPVPLLHAVITAESAYDPNAISRAGAVGLMQLMPETARRYGVADRRNRHMTRMRYHVPAPSASCNSCRKPPDVTAWPTGVIPLIILTAGPGISGTCW